MGADVADRAGQASLAGVIAPNAPFRAELREVVRPPFQEVFNVHEADVADFATLNTGPGIADHRITAIGVGQRKEDSLLLREVDELARLVEIVDKRLVANDRDSEIEEEPAGFKMKVVGRHDYGDVDPVISRPLPLRHFYEGAVNSVGCQVERLAGFLAGVRTGRESPRDDIEPVAEAHRGAVIASEEGSFASTDHADLEALPFRYVVREIS